MNRKMMATISELSMFQATAMKLQQERDLNVYLLKLIFEYYLLT